MLTREELQIIVTALDAFGDRRAAEATEWAEQSNDVLEGVFERARAVVAAASAFDDALIATELVGRITQLTKARS